MGRRARQFTLTDADRTELERVSRSRTEARQFVERARIILGCFEGVAQSVLAKRLGTRPNTISKWRGRFAQLGMEGLKDAPRAGKPKLYVGLREKVLKTLEMPPPKGQAAWDGLRLAETVGAKKSSVMRCCRKMASNFNASVAGASARIPILPRRRRTSSGCICILRPVRWFFLWTRSRAFRRFHERLATFELRAARSCAV